MEPYNGRMHKFRPGDSAARVEFGLFERLLTQ